MLYKRDWKLNIVDLRVFKMTDSEERVSQSLADTQPASSSQETEQEKENKPLLSWGQLYPLFLVQKSPYNLVEDVYTVGRSKMCDITINQEDVGMRCYLQISKVQFSVKKVVLESGSTATCIADHSSNGTFVNGQKVGKNIQMISNNDVISVVNSTTKMFLFTECNKCTDDIPEQVKRQYLVSRLIGKGGFGEVREVFEKRTTKRYAMKSVEIDEVAKNTNVFNEIIVLYKTCHENIVKMRDIIKANCQVFFVLEFMAGGDLSVKLKKTKCLSEPVTKHIFYQCCLGLQYLHVNKIIHRDMKPGNVLLSSNDQYPIVKIADFGLSTFLTSSTVQATSICGTPHYGAPELMYCSSGSSYNNKVDVWSLGVILYLCLSGNLPFVNGQGGIQLSEQIRSGTYSFKHKIWRVVSGNAKHIVQQMLMVNPIERISLYDILCGAWIDKDAEMKARVRDLSSLNQQILNEDTCYFPVAKKSRSSSPSTE